MAPESIPPFLVIAYLFSWPQALTFFVGAHLLVQIVMAQSISAFDMFGGNPAFVLRVISFAVTGLTTILLISLLKRRMESSRAAELSLAESEARFRGLISQSPFPVFIFEGDDPLIFRNQAAVDAVPPNSVTLKLGTFAVQQGLV